ncbi:MAG: TonB-dependent receptor [Sphingobacterium sp.]|jgi:TonB-linked SusC/RagA family outer membrane protein|nr:TonB-dependent receptor [Sphingobacterium sp.]
MTNHSVTKMGPVTVMSQMKRLRPSCFGLLTSLLLFSTHANAQLISLSEKNKRVENVLKQITNKYQIHFLYADGLFNKIPPINIEIENQDVDAVLKEVLKGTGISYTKHGNNITLSQSTTTNRQEKIQITGTVADSNGDAITGATVSLKTNPDIGTQTDKNGKFVLEVPKGAMITISYVGFISKEVQVLQGGEYPIVLSTDATGLEEVVVVGFGKQKKQTMVGSVATIKGDQLRMPTRNLTNNLAGQVPGLIAIQRSGEPGNDNAEFWIRGTSSFAGGTNPLVLVDGVPRDMNDIEPDEIETFTLLKDAAATAIYGAEGANGVVLITSKRGRVQKTAISYRGEYSQLEPTRLPSFLGSVDYLSLYDEALRNEGRVPVYNNIIPKYASGQDQDLYPSTDWMSMLRKTTNNTRHTLNFRGGGERARFFVSGAYFNESGIFKQNPKADYNNNIGLKRYNLRSNIDLDVTSSTLLRIDLSGQYLETNYPGTNSDELFRVITMAPPYLFPMVYSNGQFAGHPRFNSGSRINPYNLLMESGYTKEWRNFIQSRVDIEQKLTVLTPGLMAKGSISYDGNSIYKMKRLKTPEQYTAVGRDINGDLVMNRLINEVKMGEPVEENSGNKKIYIEGSLNYNRVFAEKHTVGGMLLYYQKSQQYQNDALAYKKQAYVGRATYLYDNRYSIEANFGLTGSETFAKGHRFGFFPAVGLAWIASNEPYFPESLKSSISSLKFRASIGRTGNDNTGGSRFLYRPTYSTSTGYPLGIGGSGSLNSIDGMIEGRFAAPELAWEIEDKRNYGIDLSLFKGKIDLTADYFDNLRTNILLQRRTVSDAAGFRQSPWQNYGKVSNKGVDGSINMRHNFTPDLLVSLRGNVTYARNKILEYDEVPQLYPWMNTTGNRLNMQMLYIADGLYTANDFDITTNNDGSKNYQLKSGLPTSSMSSALRPGDIRYVDKNGDGVINQFDQTQYEGNPNVPELIYGVGINVNFRGFYVSAFFQGAGNTSTILGGDANGGFFPFTRGIEESSLRSETLNRWTEENPSQDVMFPRLRSTDYQHNRIASTWWLRDASFLRLKNVEIGYQLTNRPLKKTGFKAARVYITGQNIAVWDKIKMWDPEIGNLNAGLKYPLPRIWTAGIELTL